MLMEARVSATQLVSTVTQSVTGVTALTAAQFTPTITRSTDTQGANSFFTITWTSSIYVLDAAVIQLDLPLNQIILQQGVTNFGFADVNSATIGFTQIVGSPTATHYRYSVTEWLCGAPYCGPGTVFTIRINSAKNPFVQSTSYDNFALAIRTSAGVAIAATTSPILATPALAFAKIDVTTIAHSSSQYVARDTTYAITATVQSDIPQGGSLRVTFPPNRVLLGTSSITCKLGTVTYVCGISYPGTGTTVTINGVCPSSNCVGPITYSISLSGAMRNPSTVQTISGQFSVESLTSGGFIVGLGQLDNSKVTSILPEPFITYAVTRTNIYMSAQADVKVSFTTINAVPSNGFFRVIVPIDQASVPSNPTCKSDPAFASLTCKVIFKTSTTVWIDINQSCQGGCSAGQPVGILLQDITNPSTFAANSLTSSWQIYTMNSNKEYIDGISSGLKATPDLIGKTSIIQMIALQDPIISRQQYLQVGIVTGSQMTTDAIIDLTFPNYFAFFYGDSNCFVTVGQRYRLTCSFAFYPSGYINTVSIFDACPLQCSQDTTYYFEIPIKNRGDTYYTSANWKVTSRYAYIDVGTGSLANPLKFTADTIKSYDVTNRGCDTIDAECNIYLSFKPVNHVNKGSLKGRIRIVMPTQITPSVGLCQASFDKNTAGMNCQMSGYTIIVTHNQESIVGQNITIELKRVFNPPSTKPTDPFQIYTEQDAINDGNYYQTDQNIQNLTYNVSGLTYLLAASVQRTALIDNNGYRTGQPTQLYFQIQLRHSLETTSSFVVQFPPAAQVMLRTAASSYSCYSTDSSGEIKNVLLCEVNSNNRTIIVRNFCQVSTCERRDWVRFKMYDDFVQNYYYAVSPLDPARDSIVINTTTKEGYYYLDTANTSMFAKPDLIATQLIMPSPEVLRTNNVVNKRTRWVFSFKTNKNPVPAGGYLQINIPQDVLLTIKQSTIDVLAYDTNQPYSNFTYTLYPDKQSVKQINVWNFCQQGCSVGTAYSVVVDWVKNPLSQSQIDQTIAFELRTQEGWLAESGITPSVKKLFSELIPVRIANHWIRPVNPTPGAITDYEFIFSADAEFSNTDSLMITFPNSEINLQVSTSRVLQSRCQSLFYAQIILKCQQIGSNKIRIDGLFVNNFKHYGLVIKNIQNPSVSGPSGTIQVEIINKDGFGIASRSTNSRVNILDPQPQNTCNKVCGTCAGNNATCTSCKVPSKYPIFRDYQCVDTCGKGFYFERQNLQCVQCHHSCNECFGPGNNQCQACAIGYFNEDGQCNPYCTKNLQEDLYTRSCLNRNQTNCAKSCATCSGNTSYCLTCDKNSQTPVLDRLSGRCIPNNQELCNNTFSSRYYIDQSTLECKTCNELCKTCEKSSGTCTSCQEFQLNNIVNELYETCVDFCGLGTWYNKKTNVCSFCNPVCLMCTGYNATECQVCNKTPEARQLYRYKNQCVLSCPKQYYINELTNECQQGQAQILSFSFLFMFASVAGAVLIILSSVILTKCKNKTLDVVYALVSSVEFVNRFCLLGNLWIKTNVFSLAVCFMNLIATCAIAVFFNFLFMSPIYAHSPHFRTLYKKSRLSYQTVTCLSYFVGVNMMRLLCSGFLNRQALKSDLNNWKFFVVPLNTMANFTAIFTAFQIGLCVYILMTLTVSDDAFILAILGLFLNAVMLISQIFKHFSTRTFLIRHS